MNAISYFYTLAPEDSCFVSVRGCVQGWEWVFKEMWPAPLWMRSRALMDEWMVCVCVCVCVYMHHVGVQCI